MTSIFEIASNITGPWSLAAFAIAAILFFLLKLRKIPATIAGLGIIALVLLGLVPLLIQHSSFALYRVRVNVVSPQGVPIEDAKVWSSLGGEPKKVLGGWQFEIPASTVPADRNLAVWASLDAAFLKGYGKVELGGDQNPTMTIYLDSDKTASVRGLVTDRSGHAIPGAHVSVAGYESESVLTQDRGNFVVPAHASRDQHVLLHVEARGYAGAAQWHPAGDVPAVVVLDHEKRK